MKKNYEAWIRFYMEFADKLLEYKDNRTELIQKIRKAFNIINTVKLQLQQKSTLRRYKVL